MLKLFQNQGKTLRWIMGALLFLIAGSMVITLVPSVFSTQQSGADGQVLVEVGSRAVTVADLDARMRSYLRGGDIPAETLTFFAGNAVEDLIGRRVLLNEADELGLIPNDEELAQWMRVQFTDLLFPDGKFVGAAAYGGFVRRQFQQTIAEFEAGLMEDIAVEMRLRRMVTDSVGVSDEEVRNIFHERNDRAQVEWAAVDRDDLRSAVSVTEEKLAEYFEANKLRYRKPEERACKLIEIGADYATDDIDLSETEIEIYYRENQYRFENPERYQVRHILFATMEKSEEESEEARKKAEEVLEQLRGGGDFEALAAEHSEDPANADTGGDLGWITPGSMVPEFEQAAFALQAGELSPEPVKTDYGYHLIRLDAKEAGAVKPLDEVRGRIREDLIVERSQSTRLALIDNTLAAAEEHGVDLEKAGEAVNLPVMAFESFSRDALPDDLPQAARLLDAVFSRDPEEIFSVAQDGTLYIGVVTGVTPAREGALDEFRGEVRDNYIDDEATKLAREKAEGLAEKARENGGNLAAAARALGIKASKSDFVKRSDSISGFGGVSALGPEAFAGAAESVIGPVASGSRFAVYRSIELEAADESALADESDSIREEELERKRERLFDYFRAQKLQEYADSGRVVRHEARIQEYMRFLRSRG